MEEGRLERLRLRELLHVHHRNIGSVLNEAEEALDSPEASRAKSLAMIRWQLMRRLRAYQLFKHAEIFDPVFRGNEADKVKAAYAMKCQCTALGKYYDEHVRKRSNIDTASNWFVYRTEAEAIIDSIRKHLLREGRESEILMSEGKSLLFTLTEHRT